MKKSAAAVDDRQGVIPIDLPPGPRLSSDERARDELRAMVEALAAAKTHPWSARLLGWQLRRFAALSQLLTPLDRRVEGAPGKRVGAAGGAAGLEKTFLQPLI